MNRRSWRPPAETRTWMDDGIRWLPVVPACLFLLFPVPPIQDLPAQAALLQAHAIGPNELWTFGSWFGHSAAFHALGGLLARALGGLAAARVLALLGWWLLPIGTWRLARHLGGDEDLAIRGGTVLALGHLPFLGFLPFQVALGTTLCLLPGVLRQRTPWQTMLWAFGSSALVWQIHALALPALWMGIGALAPDRPRRWAMLAAIPLPVLLWWVARSGPVHLLVPPDSRDLSDRVLTVARFLGPPASGPWWLPGLWLGAVLVVHLRKGIRTAFPGRGMAVVLLVFLAGALVLPDFVERPRIVHPWIRIAPFVGALMVASLPRAVVPALLRPATLVVLVVLTVFTGVLAWHENRLLRPVADSIRSLPRSETVLGVTLHRPPAGSWMRTYPGLHLPFLYQAEGLGATLAPFTHGDLPIRLQPEPARVADLALQDVRRYVEEGRAVATLAVTDGGDDATFLDVSGLAGLPPCPVPFPDPWQCLRLRPSPGDQ